MSISINLDTMKCVVVVLACALCLCSGYDLNTDSDGSIGLPPTGDDVQPMDSNLKADKSFMVTKQLTIYTNAPFVRCYFVQPNSLTQRELCQIC